MLRLRTVALVFAAICLHAQDSDTARKFIGEWTAKYKDTVICTIRLKPGDPISGESEDCNISVDANGDVQEPDPASHSDEPSPILNAKLQGSTLAFEEKEGDEVIKFEFTVVGDGKAELKLINAPVPVKPIPFSRERG